MAAAQASQSRPWNPNIKFVHSDRERWICIYPAYINSRKTLAEGRRIPKEKAVDNPTYSEIRDVLAHAGLTIGVENKVYPRELDARDLKYRGRIRVQLRNDEGEAMLEQFPSRRSILFYLGDKIPQMKHRVSGGGQGAAASGSSQPAAASGGSGSGGGGAGKKKKTKRK